MPFDTANSIVGHVPFWKSGYLPHDTTNFKYSFPWFGRENVTWIDNIALHLSSTSWLHPSLDLLYPSPMPSTPRRPLLFGHMVSNAHLDPLPHNLRLLTPSHNMPAVACPAHLIYPSAGRTTGEHAPRLAAPSGCSLPCAWLEGEREDELDDQVMGKIIYSPSFQFPRFEKLIL